MRIRNAAAILLLLSGLTACTASGSPGGKAVSPSTVPPRAQSTDDVDRHKMPTSPLTYFATGGNPVKEILNRISQDAASCMTDAGFEYHASVVKTDGIFSIQTPEGAIEQARASGYVAPKRDAYSAGAVLHKKLLKGLISTAASSYLLALDGERDWQREADGALVLPPTWASGCAAHAARHVLAGVPEVAPEVSDQIAGAFSRVDSSRELADSVARWSRWMASHGIVAVSPAEAIRLVSKMPPVETASLGPDPKSIVRGHEKVPAGGH